MAAPPPEPRSTSSLRATAHPVRLQILSLLTGAALSAAEVARELDITHANASYHLRTLAAHGLVVEAGEERIRGGVAKRYRHPWDAEDAAGSSPAPEDADRYVHAMAQELVRRYAHRSRAGTLTDAELWVTPEVFERVRAMVHEASLLLHGEARPPRTPGTVPVAMTAAVFGLDHGDGADEPAGVEAGVAAGGTGASGVPEAVPVVDSGPNESHRDRTGDR